MTWWNRRNTKAITTLVKQIAALTAMLTVLSCAGCATSSPNDNEQSQSSDSSQTHEQVKKSAEQSIDGAHLRDNESLYKVYDDSGVETMYLTVSRGNSSEGTDHSWSEINQYSVDDYAAMGVDRYKVNGLLQVGDEQGPVSGELGFGESAPNATVQIRGQSSSKNEQKNYKIELKSGKGKWRGQRTIALNKHMGEGLRFRNKMAYDLIKGIDQMMGLRTQFVHLYVKDETSGSDSFDDYGLYTQVEQLNKTALQVHGLDKNGSSGVCVGVEHWSGLLVIGVRGVGGQVLRI
ncbi:CotH protein [Bifidobacterium reuteri DSM 23975]|uniref:CotH protein n=2 Tax=Bifidobacterium reuteri TaxID=983706 RepID=A0A087CTG7_9BIFI|nr:CotH kinase family protein [Bifidobacterium reuteri]KFI86567.1 CotH protein [Bifidobacterium reuteri DSM 23975]